MKNNASEAVRGIHLFPLRLIAEGLAVGAAAGLVVTAYRWLLEKAGEWLSAVLDFTAGSPWKMAGWFAVLLLIAVIVGKLVKWEPMISGSGIPQLEGEMAGKLDQTWWRVLAAKFCGGFLCLLGGLSLGREGPSIQLGAMEKACPGCLPSEKQKGSFS